MDGKQMMMQQLFRALGLEKLDLPGEIEKIKTALPKWADDAQAILRSIDAKLATVEAQQRTIIARLEKLECHEEHGIPSVFGGIQ